MDPHPREWARASADYVRFRPGPPPSFYEKLAVHDVGLPGQRILDLGTGTGAVARSFAKRGSVVTGVDASPEQLEHARIAALADGVRVTFVAADAERTGLAGASFDVVTANQCWKYFRADAAVAEVKRVLRPGGWLVVSDFRWLPRADAIARATERLILEHNPAWEGADWSGAVPPVHRWAEGRFVLRAMYWYDEPVPFTRETWRGRIRACGGVGATLPPEAVAEFDAAHERLLAYAAPESFTVRHRLDVHIYEPA